MQILLDVKNDQATGRVTLIGVGAYSVFVHNKITDRIAFRVVGDKDAAFSFVGRALTVMERV